MPDMPPASPTQAAGSFPDRRTTLILLAVLTLPYLLALAVSIFFALASPMVFDAPGSNEDAASWVIFALWCSCPIVFIIGIVGGWLSFLLRRYRLALTWMLLPALEIGVFVIASLFLAIL